MYPLHCNRRRSESSMALEEEELLKKILLFFLIQAYKSLKRGGKSFPITIFLFVCLDYDTHDNSRTESRRRLVLVQIFLFTMRGLIRFHAH